MTSQPETAKYCNEPGKHCRQYAWLDRKKKGNHILDAQR